MPQSETQDRTQLCSATAPSASTHTQSKLKNDTSRQPRPPGLHSSARVSRSLPPTRSDSSEIPPRLGGPVICHYRSTNAGAASVSSAVFHTPATTAVHANWGTLGHRHPGPKPSFRVCAAISLTCKPRFLALGSSRESTSGCQMRGESTSKIAENSISPLRAEPC